MVWYFNFCSPHLNDDQNVNLSRALMVVEMIVAMLITWIVHMLAELYDEESSRVKNEADPVDNQKANERDEESAFELHKNNDDRATFKEKMGSTMGSISRRDEPGFFKSRKIFFLSTETVENKAPIFLGHYLISLAACAMYSPFMAQTIIGALYLVTAICMLIFDAWKYERWLTISIAACYILILALVTSATVGVGLTNWDPFTINCFYTKLVFDL